ncbi:MAG: iron ABC transporter permease [Desulfobacteraceae bacterium]
MKNRIGRFLLLGLPLPVIVLSLFIGPSESVKSAQIVKWLSIVLHLQTPDNTAAEEMIRLVIEDVRIPRILLSFLVGGSLAMSGSALQALFRNPLVSTYILGLQSGAAFGAALALCTAFLSVQLSAFFFGLLAVGISFFLARKEGAVSAVTLILAGVVVTGIFTALLTIVQFLTDPFKLQTIVHWTMGNLHTATWDKFHTTWWLMIAGCMGLYLLRWRMNILALGDDEARAVGLNPEHQKILLLVAAAMASSAAVSVAGVIGMVGLVIPHMVRMLVGADNQILVPICFTFGGSFLLIVDNISRTAAGFEIPIGIFTTLIGGPFFIFLLKRTKLGWEL